MFRPVLGTLLATALLLPGMATADEILTLAPTSVTDWKAVYGLSESRDRVPARARSGGTLTRLGVTEGDLVEAGQVIARIDDEKLGFQLSAMDSQLETLEAQLENARAELKRGEELLARGVTTAQRMDALRTQVDVLDGRIEGTRAERRVIEQRALEGDVLAPLSGRVLDVPVTTGAVVLPGEAVATIGGGGFFLRLSVPERHAATLSPGDTIQIGGTARSQEAGSGRIAKVYPVIQSGRVIVDVEVDGMSDAFVDARILVRLPVGTRQALLIPQDRVITRSGLDFVAAMAGDAAVLRSVVLGQRHVIDDTPMVEILTGAAPGDRIATEATHD